MNQHTGGFCLIPDSHKQHDNLLQVAGEGNRNFVKVPVDFPELSRPQVLPICRAGDMVLWDSRTIHCNTPAFERPITSSNEPLRMVGYVCMTPRSLADEATLAARIKIFERGLSTSHWPHLFPYEVDDDPEKVVTRIHDIPAEQKALI